MSWDSGGRKRIWGRRRGDKTEDSEDFIFKTRADVLVGTEAAVRVCIPLFSSFPPCH